MVFQVTPHCNEFSLLWCDSGCEPHTSKMEGSIHHTGRDYDQAPQTLVFYWAQITVSNSCLDCARVCGSHTHSVLVLHEESCNGLSQAKKSLFLEEILGLVLVSNIETERAPKP